MKKTVISSFVLCLSISLMASDKDSTISYNLPDSVKAVQFISEIHIKSLTAKKEFLAGIRTDAVKVYLESDKNEKEIVFEYPKSADLIVAGINVKKEKGELSFDYNWSVGENIKFLIAQATDSAGNFSLYSGYAFLPKENKWKLIGTCRIKGRWNTLQQPAGFYSKGRKDQANIIFNEAWVQRNSGGWKNLMQIPGVNLPNPQINLFGHIDSIQQRSIESELMNATLKGFQYKDGVAYTILKEGNGKQVGITDTVSVFYHLNILNDTTTIDEAKNTPARFPLNRLIRGWSIGVPLIKVGGKIRLVIPSDLAYSIRTRSAKIPPNSILVFDIEVVDAKPPN